MGTALSVNERVNSVRSMLSKDYIRQQVAMAAPKHVTPDRVLRVMMTTVQQIPKLAECTPESLIGSLLTCTQLGLEPDGASGMAYLIPYKTTCTLIIGYRGMMRLARQSGEIDKLEAKVVYAGDKFDFAFGTADHLTHVPAQRDPDAPEPEVHYVYAIAKLKSGSTQFEVMTKAEVENIRKRSQAGNSGPWVTDWAEMAKKTVMRKLCKYLPSSAELQSAISLDEEADRGVPQTLYPVTITAEPSTEKPSQDGAAASIPPAPQTDADNPGARPGKLADDTYKKVHKAAMALPAEIRKKIFEQFGLRLVTDAKKLDAETANDLLIELTQAGAAV